MNRETHSSRTPPEVLPQASSSAHTLPNAPAITIHLLPAYVLNKILEYTLYLPTEHFAGPAFFSDEDWPRFGSCRRTPAVLLVCRTWLVAGEGYLYEAVSVRSAEEAKALNIKLSNNPGLATKVKRLALYPAGPGIRQSPFSLPFRQVLQAVGPTVHTLRLSMHFGAEETVGGLTGGLGYLSPTRLLLSWSSKNRRRDGGLNEKSRVVTEGLHGQIPLWNRLTRVECADSQIPHWLANALAWSPSIQELRMPGVHAALFLSMPEAQLLVAKPSFRGLILCWKSRWERRNCDELRSFYTFAAHCIVSQEGDFEYPAIQRELGVMTQDEYGGPAQVPLWRSG